MNSPSTYSLRIRTLLVFTVACVMSLATTAAAQTFEITGTITSETDGSPLPGASVVEMGTQTGTSADPQGRYTLNVSGPNATVVVTFIGFLSQQIDVNGRNTINIALEEDVEQMEEVVVTAFGIERQQRALGYSVSRISGESLRESRETNVANALSGKIAGVAVSKPATGPAGSSRVIIRGNKSLEGNNQPLYVVDGVPIDNSSGGQAGMWGGVDEGDQISGINPDDIENISVLKGPSAAALYGTRAQNGVVLITTKTGRTQGNMLGVEFNSNVTFEDALVGYSDYQTEYGQGSQGLKPTDRESALDTGTQSWGALLDGSMVPQFDGVARPYSAVDDKLDRFYQSGLTATNTLALTGGVGGTTFRASASALNNQSIVESATMDRYTISLRGTSQFGSKLSSDVKINYVFEDVDNRTRLSDSPGNPNYTIGILPSNVDPQVLAPGHLSDNELRELEFDRNVFSTNPYWAVDRFVHRDNENRFLGFGLLRYEPLDWLAVQGRVGQDWYNTRYTNVTPYGTAYSLLGNMNERELTVMERNWDFLVTADQRVMSDVGVSVALGGNRMDRVSENLSVGGSTFNIPTLQTVSNLANQTSGYGYSQKRINSIYGSAEFSYRDFAFVTVTGRNDWSSTLPSDNNSYFYPSVSGSLVFSDIINLPSFLSFGKLRASWAQVGGDTDPYRLNLSYGLTNPHLGTALGFISQNAIPLAQLKPSNSEGIETGFEMRFMENRFGVDFTWYTQSTTNQILSTTVVQSSGFGSKVINAGEMKNSGIELMLNTTPFFTPDLRWDLDLNFGLNRNEVVELTEGLDRLNLDQPRGQNAFVVAQKGEPFSTIRGTTWVRDGQGNIVVNSNGVPLVGPHRLLGVGVPDWTGGILNTLRYKNVSLSALVDVSWGGSIYSGTNRVAFSQGLHQETLVGRDVCEQVGWDANPDADGRPTGCWVPENTVVVTGGSVAYDADGNITEDTRTFASNTRAIFPQSWYGSLPAEAYIYDASYIKLRELQLRFRIPNGWVQGLPIQVASVSLVGRNLWLIHSKVPNVDPESAYNNSNAQGLEWAGVPQTRSIGFNVNVRM